LNFSPNIVKEIAISRRGERDTEHASTFWFQIIQGKGPFGRPRRDER